MEFSSPCTDCVECKFVMFVDSSTLVIRMTLDRAHVMRIRSNGLLYSKCLAFDSVYSAVRILDGNAHGISSLNDAPSKRINVSNVSRANHFIVFAPECVR